MDLRFSQSFSIVITVLVFYKHIASASQSAKRRLQTTGLSQLKKSVNISITLNLQELNEYFYNQMFQEELERTIIEKFNVQ